MINKYTRLFVQIEDFCIRSIHEISIFRMISSHYSLDYFEFFYWRVILLDALWHWFEWRRCITAWACSVHSIRVNRVCMNGWYTYGWMVLLDSMPNHLKLWVDAYVSHNIQDYQCKTIVTTQAHLKANWFNVVALVFHSNRCEINNLNWPDLAQFIIPLNLKEKSAKFTEKSFLFK